MLADRVKYKTDLSIALWGAWGLGTSWLATLSLQVAFYFGAGLSGSTAISGFL